MLKPELAAVVGAERFLAEIKFGEGMNFYDVAPDDERFLFSRSVSGEDAAREPTLVLVDNFFEELRQRVPVP